MIRGTRRTRDHGLSSEPSADWQELSRLAERFRDRATLTAERTAEILQWRYGRPGCQVFTVKKDGEPVGWFVLGRESRGHRSQIGIINVLDVVWNRAGFDPESFLCAVARMARRNDDAVVLQARALRWCRDLVGLRRNEHGFPRTFVIGRRLPTDRIVAVADWVLADGE